MSEIISSTIAERVADQLRQDILQKKIPEGSRITVKEISQRYGAGLSPVRDAFQVLKSERLLEVIPYKHAQVLTLDRSFIENVYEYVAWLEKMMASHLLAENSAEVVAELTAINVQLKEVLEKEPFDRKTYLKLNRSFHDLFAEHEKNDIVTEQYRFYSENILTATRAAYFPSAERIKAVIAEHDAIIDALKAGNEDELTRRVYEHSANAKTDFLHQK